MFQGRIFQINYRNLINSTKEKTLEDILGFIGIEKIALTTETNKNKKIKFIDCITNYNELENHFRNTGYAEHFNE